MADAIQKTYRVFLRKGNKFVGFCFYFVPVGIPQSGVLIEPAQYVPSHKRESRFAKVRFRGHLKNVVAVQLRIRQVKYRYLFILAISNWLASSSKPQCLTPIR